jgi:hypothetical protein
MRKTAILILIGALYWAASAFAYDTVSINQIQEVPNGRDSSLYTGRYVHTGGIVVGANGPLLCRNRCVVLSRNIIGWSLVGNNGLRFKRHRFPGIDSRRFNYI